VRYAKRDRLRFSSHRDFQRALERALRRAGVPMAYSAGFSPHPKISYANSVPTGAASEAEYVEISLTRRLEPEAVRAALDTALPPGLDVVEVVEAGPGALADRLTGSVWRVELPGADGTDVRRAVADFLALDAAPVERLLKNGRRTLDARAAVVSLEVAGAGPGAADGDPATVGTVPLHLVLRHLTPSVRPEDVLSALCGLPRPLEMPQPARSLRLAQGALDDVTATVGDPLEADRPLQASAD
jgi:radical SAM-linked protein